MRRTNITWAAMLIAVLCLSLAGCSSDETMQTSSVATKTLTVSASLDENSVNLGARAGVAPDNTDTNKETFIWHTDDQFKAYLLKENQKEFESTKPVFNIDVNYKDVAPSGSASFACPNFPNDSEYKMLAVYPNSNVFTSEGKEVTCTIPNTATQIGGNTTAHLKTDMAMYATNTVERSADNIASMKFHHLTSLLRFTVKSSNANTCRIKKITVSSASNVFGTEWKFGTEVYDGSKIVSIINIASTNNVTVNLNKTATDAAGIEVSSGNTFDAYICSGQGNVLTDQTLTFSLTVTDADGANERIYTSLAIDANKIIAANNNANTFEAGKRYRFNLLLDDHQLKANILSVTPWGEGTPSGGVDSEVHGLSEHLTDLCQSNYAMLRETLTAIRLNGSAITSTEKFSYMQGNFASYFPNVTTINFTGNTIAQTHMFQGIATVITVNGESLTSLPASAFEGKNGSPYTAIENFNLPNVESVGDYCFKRCGVKIRTLSLPKVIAVGNTSFSYNSNLLHVCFASLKDFTGAYDIFSYSDNITDLAFGTAEEMTFASGTETKKVLGGSMFSGTTTQITLYLNENGYEYKNNVSGKTWRGITFKEIKKYSEYQYKKD